MISKEQIEYLTGLARIKLTKEEEEKLGKDLSSILGYIEKLNEVDTSKIKGISQVTGLENIMREDKFEKNDRRLAIRDKLLCEAPKKNKDFIQAPKTLE